MGGATVGTTPIYQIPSISIHAPRGGSDGNDHRGPFREGHFNPRSPWGERPGQMTREQFQELFQSTLPVGGATDFYKPVFANLGISIHAPRGGSDCHSFGRLCSASYFNPRSPWGERLALTTVFSRSAPFQSTLPVGGATRDKLSTLKDRVISIHAPRGGSDMRLVVIHQRRDDFNPRSPWGGATQASR